MEATKGTWTSSIGPRMAKAVNAALHAVTWEGKTRVEISGVTGVNEFRAVTTSMFGEGRPEAVVGLEDIGNRYEWTLTSENYKRVIAELDTLKRRLEESRPVIDNRRTPADEAERVDTNRAASQDRAIETRAKQAEIDRITVELRVQYPWAKQSGSDHARAASNIKRELAEAFPGIKFRVRSESFSGGNAVDVHWEDGPTTKEVDAITGKYQRGDFDGMQDLYEYDNSAHAEAVGAWLGAAKYVQTHRDMSHAVTWEIARLLCEAQGIEYRQPEHIYELRNVRNLYGWGDGEDLLTHVWRLFSTVSFPASFEIAGLASNEEAGHCEPYTLVFKTPEPGPAPTPDAPEPGGLGCEIQQHHHTKRGCDFWLVVLTDRVDRETFERLRDRCKALHGWYSRQWGSTPGGFAFELRATAEAFSKTL